MNLKPLMIAALLASPLALAQSAPASSGNTGPTHGQRSGMNHRFMGADVNKDGAVSREEALALFDKHFAAMDQNKDAKITADEMKAARAAVAKERGARYRAAFEARYKKADANQDGTLNRDEIKAGMPRLEKAFERADSNKDGQLSLDEIRLATRAHGRGQHRNHGGHHHGMHQPQAEAVKS